MFTLDLTQLSRLVLTKGQTTTQLLTLLLFLSQDTTGLRGVMAPGLPTQQQLILLLSLGMFGFIL